MTNAAVLQTDLNLRTDFNYAMHWLNSDPTERLQGGGEGLDYYQLLLYHPTFQSSSDQAQEHIQCTHKLRLGVSCCYCW